MAVTTTTLAAPVAITASTVVVTSTANIAAGKMFRIDDEMMQVQQGFLGTNPVGVLRGREGTVTAPHPITANVYVGLATDFQVTVPSGMPDSTFLPGSSPFTFTSYSATGAIAVPQVIGINVVVLNGTIALTMSLAPPPNDVDGAIIWVVGNGKAAHVVNVAGTAGLGNAGIAGYRTITFAAGAQNSFALIAANGAWVPLSVYVPTTATAIQVTLS